MHQKTRFCKKVNVCGLNKKAAILRLIVVEKQKEFAYYRLVVFEKYSSFFLIRKVNCIAKKAAL
jgi:hypothetical protein